MVKRSVVFLLIGLIIITLIGCSHSPLYVINGIVHKDEHNIYIQVLDTNNIIPEDELVKIPQKYYDTFNEMSVVQITCTSQNINTTTSYEITFLSSIKLAKKQMIRGKIVAFMGNNDAVIAYIDGDTNLATGTLIYAYIDAPFAQINDMAYVNFSGVLKETKLYIQDNTYTVYQIKGISEVRVEKIAQNLGK